MDIEELIGPPPYGKRRIIDKADFDISLDNIVPPKDDSPNEQPQRGN